MPSYRDLISGGVLAAPRDRRPLVLEVCFNVSRASGRGVAFGATEITPSHDHRRIGVAQLS